MGCKAQCVQFHPPVHQIQSVILLQLLLTDTVVHVSEKWERLKMLKQSRGEKGKLALTIKTSFQFGDDTEAS